MIKIDQIWQCPLCNGKLTVDNETNFCCIQCKSIYPAIHNIPDFRTTPWTAAKKDRFKEINRIQTLISRFHSCSYNELVEIHLSMIDGRPGILGDLDRRLRLSAIQRGKNKFEQLQSLLTSCNVQNLLNGIILEIGSGTGDMLPHISKNASFVIAIDVSMDLLILAQKLIISQGLTNIVLACASADRLPIISDKIDFLYASHVIEHLTDQKMSVKQFHRVLKRDGTIFFDSPNRFSISYEPHVQLLGVGYLPRFLMNSYVRLMRKIPYSNKRLLSYFELRRLLRRKIWRYNIYRHEVHIKFNYASLKNRIYRVLIKCIPGIIQKYIFSETFFVLAQKK
ncbi:MAG: methyltransferase domain-containing protein [Deltaproteobacteria bacterium]|nr:methyltransferase domain-containing protein [Deltaproteobacteria bacterium]